MSHFFGFLSIKNNHQLNKVKNNILPISSSLFQYDSVGVFHSDKLVLINWFNHISPESDTHNTICESENYVVVASCRLDNREELIAIIESKRGKITNQPCSDHYLILYLFEIFHEKSVELLLGDFSFVVWSKTSETLFMAKDHLGVRPLFYYKFDDDFLVFATHVSLIKQTIDRPLKLNLRYIAEELKDWQPTKIEDTFFEDIKRVKPANFYIFSKLDNYEAQERKYWELIPADLTKYASEKEIFEKLEQLFIQAVLSRTRTHKNIGCQLSGGMDSSAIAVLLARNVDKSKIHTYSFVLSDKTLPYSKLKIDERGTQQAILEYAQLQTQNHHLIEDFHYADTFDQWNQCNKVMGGYFNSDSNWEDTLFMTASKNQVGYIMSGFPGDECVSNYGDRYYYDYLHNGEITKILKFISISPWENLNKIASYYSNKYRKKYLDEAYNPRNLINQNSQYATSLEADSLKILISTFKDYIKSKICGVHPTLRMESEFLYASQYGLETVYPLADIRLIQFVYSLPTEMFRPTHYDRVIFREMCKNILPDIVRLQPKINGATTLAFWDYWRKKQEEDLVDYQVVDRLELFHSKGIIDWKNEKKKRQVTKCKIDYLINLNYCDDEG